MIIGSDKERALRKAYTESINGFGDSSDLSGVMKIAEYVNYLREQIVKLEQHEKVSGRSKEVDSEKSGRKATEREKV